MGLVHGDHATVAARSFHPGAPRNALGARLDLVVGVFPVEPAQAERKKSVG
jgi:hypothetical protein